MKQWRLQMTIAYQSSKVTTDPINVRRGIFQGDSLSPLLFCLALQPISTELDRGRTGYKVNVGPEALVINHQLYMDDIKLYGKSPRQLTTQVQTVETISSDMGMTFGLTKCATVHMKHGVVQEHQPEHAVTWRMTTYTSTSA